ncbi:uclacyanin-2-like [Silene latifolia]|uniref:uclacyanin-2-like n=1 Tax=Silene latifolia TaxID=37657 RepID=UPI003D77DB78
MAFGTYFLVMLIVAPFAFANAQTTINWALGQSYSSYSTQSFAPGATLLFNYDSTHNVLVVSKSDYDNCNTGNPLETHTDGKTTITLKQGATYFICGKPGHCVAGMKLQANAADSGSPAPTTPKSSPKTSPIVTKPVQSSPSPIGAMSPSSSAALPPKQSSGAMGLSSAGHVMFGVPLVFVALFAFMW